MAVRIAGVTIPNNKRIEVALTYIYGIGRTKAIKIVQQAQINPNTRVQNLSAEEENRLRTIIEKGKEHLVEGDLRREVFSNIKRLKDIACYRGLRHSKGLPVRGQRTKTNSRTVRGNVRRTTISGKKPAAQKT